MIKNLRALNTRNSIELLLENKAKFHYDKYGLEYTVTKVNTHSFTVIATQLKAAVVDPTPSKPNRFKIKKPTLERKEIIKIARSLFSHPELWTFDIHVHPHLFQTQL